jgi:hypothetical protein
LISPPLPVWVEIHVDDEIVARDPSRWVDSGDLLDAIASLAEGSGARLCFRIREPFARASRDSGLLPSLATRGHEIGVHAHGRGLAAAVTALRGCGVAPVVAVPGLVQAGPGGRSALLRQVASLGLGVVTDHGAEPAWAYDGLAPRTEHGVRVIAPTVRPFDWHLMDRDGTRHGVTERAVSRLRELEATAAAHGAAWFGLALHEHDLCPPHDLRPLDSAMAALGSYLDERVVPALSVLDEPPADRRTAWIPMPDARVRAGKALHRVKRRLPAPWVPRRPSLRRPARRGRAVRIEVDGRSLSAEHHRADRASAAVLMSHAGAEGGRTLALRPLGLDPRALAAEGLSLWLYDRSGTGHSPAGSGGGLAPGNPDHVRDWRAVLARAREEGLPVIALTWSGGIVPVLAAAARHGDRPDALVDAEGPVDRWSLVPPLEFEGAQAAPMRARDPWDEARWADVEAIHLIGALAAPYARLQGDPDHVHGSMTLHAERLVAAAADACLRVRDLHALSRPLGAHPGETLDALRWAVEQFAQ